MTTTQIVTRAYGESWVASTNSGGTANWQYCVEMDVAS